MTYHVEIWKGFGERQRMFGGPRQKGLVLEHFCIACLDFGVWLILGVWARHVGYRNNALLSCLKVFMLLRLEL